MYQPIGPATTDPASLPQAGDILYPVRVTLFVALLCLGYSLSRPNPAAGKEPYLLLGDATGRDSPEEWAGLPPWQRKASEKAIQRYAATQEKKWHRWNEAMFER